jgi:carbon monoxide dehydrogenase subunit G
MAVESSGEITVDVDRSAAFAVVRTPARLARCIPGCHDLREVAPDRYTAVLTSQVAFMTLSFNVTIDVTRIEAPATLEATITGDAVGLAGHVVATARLQLEEAAEHRTTLRYATAIGLTGRLGGLGQTVFKATSAKMARDFGANLKKEIEGGAIEGGAIERGEAERPA